MNKVDDVDLVLLTQSLNLYISIKQAYPRQTSPLLSNPFFKRQRKSLSKCYQHVLKPLFEKKNLKKYYTKLYGLVSWLVLMEDGSAEIAYDLSKKINSFVIYDKSENSIEMIKVCNTLFDILSVKFPREAQVKYQNLASLILRL